MLQQTQNLLLLSFSDVTPLSCEVKREPLRSAQRRQSSCLPSTLWTSFHIAWLGPPWRHLRNQWACKPQSSLFSTRRVTRPAILGLSEEELLQRRSHLSGQARPAPGRISIPGEDKSHADTVHCITPSYIPCPHTLLVASLTPSDGTNNTTRLNARAVPSGTNPRSPIGRC